MKFKLFCFHKWETMYKSGPRIVQECLKCHKKRSSIYDMGYGGTYWVKDDCWSDEHHIIGNAIRW